MTSYMTMLAALIKGMNFDFATLQEHRDEERFLNSRFAAAKTIPETQKLHFFQPLTKNTLEVKQFDFIACTGNTEARCGVSACSVHIWIHCCGV